MAIPHGEAQAISPSHQCQQVTYAHLYQVDSGTAWLLTSAFKADFAIPKENLPQWGNLATPRKLRMTDVEPC